MRIQSRIIDLCLEIIQKKDYRGLNKGSKEIKVILNKPIVFYNSLVKVQMLLIFNLSKRRKK